MLQGTLFVAQAQVVFQQADVDTGARSEFDGAGCCGSAQGVQSMPSFFSL